MDHSIDAPRRFGVILNLAEMDIVKTFLSKSSIAGAAGIWFEEFYPTRGLGRDHLGLLADLGGDAHTPARAISAQTVEFPDLPRNLLAFASHWKLLCVHIAPTRRGMNAPATAKRD
jgi:hypothetical protein